jgi:hypothetical protein
MRKILLLPMIALMGCASIVVKDEDIIKKTEIALGMERSKFTISDRTNSGVQTDFVVTTKSGKRFNCYVTGTFSQLGSVVSDAICNEFGGGAEPMKGNAECNALLKKAGKCK